MSITSSSVLVELNISVWTANKLDREATSAVTGDNNATRDAAKVHKNLMAGTSLRKDIANFAQSTRTWHNSRTLPWNDGGARLLPTSLFLDYRTESKERNDRFNELVDAFVSNYPALVTTAGQHLGSLFDADDYPSPAAVKDKFALKLTFSPVPEAGDFRLDVSSRELEELKQSYNDSFQDRLTEAMKEPWDRLHKVLTGMSDKLTVGGDDDKKRYHDSFITNAEDLCGLLQHLNVANDPKLERARKELEQTIAGTTIDELRADAYSRQDLKSKLDVMIKDIEW